MLVIVLQFDKESKSKKNFFWEGRGGGGVVAGGFEQNDTSSLQGIQMCQIILKYMLKYRRNGPDKLNL